MATPKKPASPAAEPASTPAPSFPTLDIITRRITHGRATELAPRQFHLIDQPEPMTTYVINTALDGRYHQATTQQGWVRVKMEEVAGGQTGDLRSDRGYAVMGEGGREFLMKMPTRLYQAAKRAKVEREDRAMRSKKTLLGRVTASMSEEARQAAPADAEHLERAAGRLNTDDRLGAFQLDELNVTTDVVPITREGA